MRCDLPPLCDMRLRAIARRSVRCMPRPSGLPLLPLPRRALLAARGSRLRVGFAPASLRSLGGALRAVRMFVAPASLRSGALLATSGIALCYLAPFGRCVRVAGARWLRSWWLRASRSHPHGSATTRLPAPLPRAQAPVPLPLSVRAARVPTPAGLSCYSIIRFCTSLCVCLFFFVFFIKWLPQYQ